MRYEYQHEIFNNPALWGKKIAISLEDKILAIADTYEELRQKMAEKGINYSTYAVPKDPRVIQIKTFRVKSIRKHDWRPLYFVNFLLNNGQIDTQRMLIDSGADFSVINYSFGKLLGFETTPHEIIQEAEGFGSNVKYLMRDYEIEIDGNRFINKFAWLQDPEFDDMIIGREIVFDLFDIEFKQADEEIIFKKR